MSDGLKVLLASAIACLALGAAFFLPNNMYQSIVPDESKASSSDLTFENGFDDNPLNYKEASTQSDHTLQDSASGQKSTDSVEAGFESSTTSAKNKVIADLVDIFGEGNGIPLDKEAQERLLAKLPKTKHRIVEEERKKGEHDPAYDATWETDIQIKATAEVNEFFPTASIQNYDCSNGQCALTVNLGDNSDQPFNPRAAANFMTSLRSSPAILKSGAKRNIALREIGVGENGQRFIHYAIGNVESQ